MMVVVVIVADSSASGPRPGQEVQCPTRRLLTWILNDNSCSNSGLFSPADQSQPQLAAKEFCVNQ